MFLRWLRDGRSRALLFLGAFAIVLVGVLQVFSSLASSAVTELERDASQLSRRATVLLDVIGYSGVIHEFKNCVLRPDEAGYCISTVDHAREAKVLATQLSADLRARGWNTDLSELLQTIDAYERNVAIVQSMHAEGRSPAEIDVAVRIDDRNAAAAVLKLQDDIAANLSQTLSAQQAQIAAASLASAALLVGLFGGVVLLLLRDHAQETSLLAEENAVLDAVLTAAQSGILGLDAEGRILSANPRARHILGGISESTPFQWPNAIHFLDGETAAPQEASKSPVHRALAGQVLSGEVSLLSRNEGDNPRYVRVSSSIVSSAEPQEVRTVLILDDISELERNRQQVERSSRLDALGQLTGGIAHDFNNLLGVILSSMQVVQLEDLSDRGRRLIEIALSATRRGAVLSSRLLAFGKRQPGLAMSHSIVGFLTEFERLARPSIEENITLEFVSEGDGLLVYCDTAQLEHALLNLVLNSRDAIVRSGKGSKIVVKVRGVAEIDADVLLRKESPHSYIAKGLHAEHAQARSANSNRAYRYVEFAVTDDGPGMSEEVKRRAIDPFFTTKEANSGTGLGLSMVYGFIQQSDGELRIYSEVGHGTTVRLILPRGTAQGVREAPVVRESAPRGNGQRIMIVEDEVALIEAMGEMISALGYTVLKCGSGKEALSHIEQADEIALMLSDVVMPGGIGGFELARRVRALRPDLPIVYMSGYTGFSNSEMGEVVAPLVQKPCEPAKLATVLRDAIAGEAA